MHVKCVRLVFRLMCENMFKIPQKIHNEKIIKLVFSLENRTLKSYSSTTAGQNVGFDLDFTLLCSTPAMRVSLIVGISVLYFLF